MALSKGKRLFLGGYIYELHICTFQGFLIGESEQPIIWGNIARQSFDLGRLATEAAKMLHGNTNALWVNKPTAFIFRRKRPTETIHQQHHSKPLISPALPIVFRDRGIVFNMSPAQSFSQPITDLENRCRSTRRKVIHNWACFIGSLVVRFSWPAEDGY